MEPGFFLGMFRLLRKLKVYECRLPFFVKLQIWERYRWSKKYEFTSAEKTKKETETFEAGAR